MPDLGPGDVGARVTVRVRHDGGPAGGQQDIVGELVGFDATGLEIRRRNGSVVRAPHADVLFGHVVPARSDAAGRVPDRAVQEIAAMGWRGRETLQLGGWLLRAAAGWTGRANSVLPLDAPTTSLDEALATVTAWYGERGLPARFQVPLPLCAQLDAELAARGWTPYNPTCFLTSDLGPVVRALPERADLPPVDLADAPSPGWLAAYHYRGGSLPDIAPSVLVDADRPMFANVAEAGEVVAIGRAVVDERWCGITALEVIESHRRRGLAQHALRALLQWAGGLGARHIYLQVAETNDAALALYRRLGFSVHHRYHYRLQPES